MTRQQRRRYFSGSGRTSRLRMVNSSLPPSSVTITASTASALSNLILSAKISRIDFIAKAFAASRRSPFRVLSNSAASPETEEESGQYLVSDEASQRFWPDIRQL
jgi:hypothetical protein